MIRSNPKKAMNNENHIPAKVPRKAIKNFFILRISAVFQLQK